LGKAIAGETFIAELEHQMERLLRGVIGAVAELEDGLCYDSIRRMGQPCWRLEAVARWRVE
jgi:hypothetical protein